MAKVFTRFIAALLVLLTIIGYLGDIDTLCTWPLLKKIPNCSSSNVIDIVLSPNPWLVPAIFFVYVGLIWWPAQKRMKEKQEGEFRSLIDSQKEMVESFKQQIIDRNTEATGVIKVDLDNVRDDINVYKKHWDAQQQSDAANAQESLRSAIESIEGRYEEKFSKIEGRFKQLMMVISKK